MIRNGLTWIAILTVLTALGIGSLALYVYMDGVIASYFIS
jgi:hypothetical protein